MERTNNSLQKRSDLSDSCNFLPFERYQCFPVRFEPLNFYPRVKFFQFDKKYIIRCLLMKYRLIFLMTRLKFCQILSRLKRYQPVLQKGAPNKDYGHKKIHTRCPVFSKTT